MAGKHTIILLQYSNSLQTRSFMDFPSVSIAMDALVKMYEHKLRELNPNITNITYDVSDLYTYLDSLHDLCAMVLDPSSNKYDPHDKKWIKQKIFVHLRGQAK
mmetsp:Transcript_101553/g.286384  ORF Transcript_101553/g.286384 Transcript_101553/m.286384 type:complete len:103 (+) Transcript_101553:34-342(+)